MKLESQKQVLISVPLKSADFVISFLISDYNQSRMHAIKCSYTQYAHTLCSVVATILNCLLETAQEPCHNKVSNN